MQLRVRYFREADVEADWSAQLSRGGLLVRVEPPADLQQFADVKLELVAGAAMVVLDAQVLQAFPGAGVAVRLSASPALESWAAAARTSANEDRDPEHSIVTAATRPSSESAGGDRVTQALRGSRDERMAILRENNPALHAHVLRNPGLQLDEVSAFAKLRTVTPEFLKQIADRREWAQRPEIAIALVRNPKTPVNVAIKLLDFVGAAELRQLAKDQHTRAPIQQAARKKVIG
ncbi:MAG: hypothetical protein HYV09_39550 [Deltaproteobacteria bacterium]|nr:hypothetical protein [Deltaproteobacteria bacterium]